MARKIVCEVCNRQTIKSVAQFGEIWETIRGTPIKELSCDDCGVQLDCATLDSNCETCGQKVKGSPVGDICYAGVLLDSKTNPMYERQKPDKWASAYINEVITCSKCHKETTSLKCIHCDHDNEE